MTIVEFLNARWDDAEFREPSPTDVMADIAAKRRVMAWYVDSKEWGEQGHHDEYASDASGLKTALVLLASAYAEHPDFNPEWKP